MSKLTALKKQIAALEARAERIAKEEMSSAIAKVKGIMAGFNLTIEHLTQAVGGKRAAKKTKAKAASVAKYADPKIGKRWSGFGRAPGWIAGAKNRDAFLVGKGAAADSAAQGPRRRKEGLRQGRKGSQGRQEDRQAGGEEGRWRRQEGLHREGRTSACEEQACGQEGCRQELGPEGGWSRRAAAASVEPSSTPAT
jgi:DNA-binding protein H-NS